MPRYCWAAFYGDRNIAGGGSLLTTQQPKLDQQHDTRREAAALTILARFRSHSFSLALPLRYITSALVRPSWKGKDSRALTHPGNRIAQAIYHFTIVRLESLIFGIPFPSLPLLRYA